MHTKSNEERRQEYLRLGHYLFYEYNRVTGIFSYDPEGFKRDVSDQIDALCAEENNAIRAEANEARAKLLDSIHILRLEGELAISNAQIAAYDRIFAMSEHFVQAVSKSMDDLAERLQTMEIEFPDDMTYQMREQDNYLAFNLAVYNGLQAMKQRNSERFDHFTDWAKRAFRHMHIDR